MSSGHIPQSLSLPFTSLLSQPTSTTPPYRTLLPPEELRRALVEALGSESRLQDVLEGHRKVVGTCGSGMTAAVIWLAFKTLGANDVGIYDEV
jgi:thiosulfate/3-mercaptopyruvate sulfurtransferase